VNIKKELSFASSQKEAHYNFDFKNELPFSGVDQENSVKCAKQRFSWSPAQPCIATTPNAGGQLHNSSSMQTKVPSDTCYSFSDATASKENLHSTVAKNNLKYKQKLNRKMAKADSLERRNSILRDSSQPSLVAEGPLCCSSGKSIAISQLSKRTIINSLKGVVSQDSSFSNKSRLFSTSDEEDCDIMFTLEKRRTASDEMAMSEAFNILKRKKTDNNSDSQPGSESL